LSDLLSNEQRATNRKVNPVKPKGKPTPSKGTPKDGRLKENKKLKGKKGTK
jgi:hypothetical protein